MSFSALKMPLISDQSMTYHDSPAITFLAAAGFPTLFILLLLPALPAATNITKSSS